MDHGGRDSLYKTLLNTPPPVLGATRRTSMFNYEMVFAEIMLMLGKRGVGRHVRVSEQVNFSESLPSMGQARDF